MSRQRDASKWPKRALESDLHNSHTRRRVDIALMPLENEVISSNINISDFRITNIIESDAKNENSNH